MIPTRSDDQDREDMLRLRSGNDPALNALMERHGERLFQYLLRQLSNQSEAEDIVQETFVRIYHNRDRFDAKQRFSTWLYTIATNLLRDRFRWIKRHPQTSLDSATPQGGSLLDALPESNPGPDEQLAFGERAAQVQHAIQSLPDDLRNALILSEYQELSHAEAGAILNCSPKAVETRIYRAKALLRKALQSLL